MGSWKESKSRARSASTLEDKARQCIERFVLAVPMAVGPDRVFSQKEKFDMFFVDAPAPME